MPDPRPRSFRGLLFGSRNEGFISMEFLSSNAAFHACDIDSLDGLLAQPSMLGPGVYLLVGAGREGGAKLRAVIGESGMLHERLAAHATDDALSFVWEIGVITGPRIMNETVRLILQRRLVDEVSNHGTAAVVNRRDAERFVATEHDIAAASEIMIDVRFFTNMLLPGLIASVEPVLGPISSRCAGPPRGLDPLELMRTTHEMRWRGAYATATMLGAQTVLLPGSRVIARIAGGAAWIRRRREELFLSGVLTKTGDERFLAVAAFITFRTPREATAFVTGGASASPRLTWLPVDAA